MRDKLAPGGPRSDQPVPKKDVYPSLDFLPLLCSALAFSCIIFITVSLGTHEWIAGTARVSNGQPVEAYVGLGSVTMRGESKALSKMCPKGSPTAIPEGYVDTPPAIWCKCESAGTVGAWLVWLAYFPLWAACLLSAVEGLATSASWADGIKAQLESMGLRARAQHIVLIASWALTWLMLFLALLAYAASVPDTLGWGVVTFQASFGLARLSFLLVTMGTALMSAKLLKLWHEENFTEALGDFYDARGIRQALYYTLLAQLVLYLLVSVNNLEWQALVPLFGLYYLDTEKTNFLVLYVTLVVMTLLFDFIHLLGLPAFSLMEGKEAFGEGLYIIIFVSKFACLGLFFYQKRLELRDTTYPTTGEGDEPEIAE